MYRIDRRKATEYWRWKSELISLTFLDSAKTAVNGVSDTTCAKALYSIGLEVDIGQD